MKSTERHKLKENEFARTVAHARGRNERTYRVRIVPSWAREGSSDVRVTVVIETPALHRRLLRQSFVITPDNQLQD
jgi:hypothetical protein